MSTMLHNGIQLRWLNTAGFEMILPSGSHLLVDPWLDHSDIYPISIDDIQQADYILLSHVHFDHAQDTAPLLKKFPKAKLLVGDLSTDALCQDYPISLTNIYRIRSGEVYEFDDIKINVYAGRHTENAKGAYRPAKFASDDVTSFNAPTNWYGSMELNNFLITTDDGTQVLIWAGQTTADQKHRFARLYPDIALMHLSPKQDPSAFADMVKAMGAKVVIPHHHDMTAPLFNSRPDLVNLMLSEEAKAAYIVDGKFSSDAFVGRFKEAIKAQVPGCDMMELEHHTWYHFGLAFETIKNV